MGLRVTALSRAHGESGLYPRFTLSTSVGVSREPTPAATGLTPSMLTLSVALLVSSHHQPELRVHLRSVIRASSHPQSHACPSPRAQLLIVQTQRRFKPPTHTDPLQKPQKSQSHKLEISGLAPLITSRLCSGHRYPLPPSNWKPGPPHTTCPVGRPFTGGGL